MRSRYFSTLLVIFLSLTLSACAAIEAQRKAQEQKQEAFAKHMDIAHIWVTEGDAPQGKPYHVLGEIKYSENVTPETIADAIDAHKMNEKLKQMAYKKYPDDVDAVIKAHSDVSTDGNLVTVTAQAIQYESSADREMMHKMNEGIVASPSGD
jgi:hypothetical protein